MNENRLPEYIGRMQQAATDGCSFVEGQRKADFLEDKRTQQAVILSLIIIGEAATKVMDIYPEFTHAHPGVPWRSMCGMRNRIAQGHFAINLDVVWDTVQTALPDLLKQLPTVRQEADEEAVAFRLPLIGDDGEVGDLSKVDAGVFRPAAEVLPPDLLAGLVALKK